MIKSTKQHCGLLVVAAVAAAMLFGFPSEAVGATPIVLSDDGFALIPIGFTFNFCGTDHTSVYVNANGNLTFENGDSDFTESASQHLDLEPRIAGLWDDLSPNAGGTVEFESSNNTFTVTYTDVPEFPGTGANTFSITLNRSRQINFSYGDLTATDGLAGLSCGGAVTIGTETGSDLTALSGSTINLGNAAALYEVFSFANPNDLANSTFIVKAPNEFRDLAEPNNSIGHAGTVRLPFNSGDSFTEIRPRGDDVDYFQFTANAGDTLLAEVTDGNLDSLIGLFDDATGVLLALDDDGGAGLLSKLLFTIPATGKYVIAVTTFNDFDFNGVGTSNSGGRYVLDIDVVDELVETILSTTDDGNVQVNFLCGTFDFQGNTYSSVFVNANGNLTFGSGDSDFSESVGEFLSDQPRIAPLWHDLSPNQGGTVTLTRNSSILSVEWAGVPEFLAGNDNNLTVTLTCATGDISYSYGNVDAVSGIVGITEGGGALDPGETDLSGAILPLPGLGTTYEEFTGDFDLDGSAVDFEP